MTETAVEYIKTKTGDAFVITDLSRESQEDLDAAIGSRVSDFLRRGVPNAALANTPSKLTFTLVLSQDKKHRLVLEINSRFSLGFPQSRYQVKTDRDKNGNEQLYLTELAT